MQNINSIKGGSPQRCRGSSQLREIPLKSCRPWSCKLKWLPFPPKFTYKYQSGLHATVLFNFQMILPWNRIIRSTVPYGEHLIVTRNEFRNSKYGYSQIFAPHMALEMDSSYPETTKSKAASAIFNEILQNNGDWGTYTYIQVTCSVMPPGLYWKNFCLALGTPLSLNIFNTRSHLIVLISPSKK